MFTEYDLRLEKLSYLLNIHTISYYHRVISEKRKKKGYDFNACNNVRDILYNTDIINSIVKLIVHSPVAKLVCK